MNKHKAAKLKKGDLVVIDAKGKTTYKGMVLEVESVSLYDKWHYRVTMKQPGFDNEFRVRDYDSRLLKRYEAL